MAIGTSFQDAILLETSIRSEISPSTPNIYIQINVIEGLTYTFTTLSDGDLMAYLYDANKNQIASDDDSGEGYNPLIKFTATYTGKMFIMVRAYGSGYTIPFEAHLSEVQPIQGDSFNTAIQIEPGEGQTISLIPNAKETYFKANLKQDGLYKIQSKTDYDLRVYIYDSYLMEFAGDDDSGGNYNFLCKFTAETSLVYFKIYSYSQIGEGVNDVTIDLSEDDGNKVSGVSISTNPGSLKIGKTFKLNATVTPSTAIDKSVIWESLNPDIAIVDNNGLVTAISLGSVQIRVTTNDGGYTSTVYFNTSLFEGSGRSYDPYLVTNVEDLLNVEKDMDAYYIQTVNIDLSEVVNPKINDVFFGTYDGNNFTISNLTQDFGSNGSLLGLFRSVSNTGVLKNIRLENVDIKGYQNIGGLCGSVTGGQIYNCHVTGKINGLYSVGGIAGYISMNSKIEHSSVEGEVILRRYSSTSYSSGRYVGGLFGEAKDSTISKCYVNAKVDGYEAIGDHCGGLIGQATGINVDNCFTSGSVRGYSGGGLIGSWKSSPPYTDNHYVIENCHSTSELTYCSALLVGTISLYGTSDLLTIKNCFMLNPSLFTYYEIYNLGDVLSAINELQSYLFEFENNYTVDDVVFTGNYGNTSKPNGPIIRANGRITREQAKQLSTYEASEWDFKNTWMIEEGLSYPTLIPIDVTPKEPEKTKSEGYLRTIPLSKLKVVRYRDYGTNL